ncbi:hypothetical protein D3C73_1268820 [compost metagenome]
MIHDMSVCVSRGNERLPGAFERRSHNLNGPQIQRQCTIKVRKIVGERQMNHAVRSRGPAAQDVEIVQRAVQCFGSRRF